MTPSQPDWLPVCQLDELAAAGAVEFRLPCGSPGFVLARPRGPQAFLNHCPHLGLELNWQPGQFMDVDRCFIQCATHGALFNPDSGLCIAGPCQGDRLQALELKVDGDQVLVAALSPAASTR